jgi:hypothetical protein
MDPVLIQFISALLETLMTLYRASELGYCWNNEHGPFLSSTPLGITVFKNVAAISVQQIEEY